MNNTSGELAKRHGRVFDLFQIIVEGDVNSTCVASNHIQWLLTVLDSDIKPQLILNKHPTPLAHTVYKTKGLRYTLDVTKSLDELFSDFSKSHREADLECEIASLKSWLFNIGIASKHSRTLNSLSDNIIKLNSRYSLKDVPTTKAAATNNIKLMDMVRVQSESIKDRIHELSAVLLSYDLPTTANYVSAASEFISKGYRLLDAARKTLARYTVDGHCYTNNQNIQPLLKSIPLLEDVDILRIDVCSSDKFQLDSLGMMYVSEWYTDLSEYRDLLVTKLAGSDFTWILLSGGYCHIRTRLEVVDDILSDLRTYIEESTIGIYERR